MTDSVNIERMMDEIRALGERCDAGDVDAALALLAKHRDALDSPDRDCRFPYTGSELWSPIYRAAKNGHTALVLRLLEMGANPVPYEVCAQYLDFTYTDWLDELRERGYDECADAVLNAIARRYGPLVDDANTHQAVRENDIKKVRRLLDEKPERIRQVDAVGNTPLHWAVWKNEPEMVRLLVERGAPVDAENGDGRTPSVVALFGFHRWWRNQEKPEILRLLLDGGAEYTMLIAATVGDEARVRELVALDPTLANAPDPCMRRPLSGAVVSGHTNVVRLLLEAGADPNAKEAVCQGGYSLHTAAWRGDEEIARLLLERGAIPQHWVDSSGDSMYAALHNGHQRIVQMLYAHGGTMELLVYSAAHRIDVVAEVLRLDPSKANEVLPPGWDDGGNEDLACDIMRLAIRHGARFENEGAWKLRWTVRKYPKVFQLLQEHGANPNLPLLGIAGDQPRRWRDPEEQLRVVKFLVEECAADVNYRDSEGLTPLAGAAREGYDRLVDYFLARGANRNPDVPDYMKPCRLAERNGHTGIAERLRERDAAD